MSITMVLQTRGNTQDRVIENSDKKVFCGEEIAQASLVSSVPAASAGAALSAGTSSPVVGASTAIASASLFGPLMNSSASLGLGRLYECRSLCAWMTEHTSLQV